MEHVLTYSLRRYLDDYFSEISRAVIIEDGIELDKLPKPYATIEYRGQNDAILSAGRVSYEETLHYQLGLYANTNTELSKLQAVFKELLRAPLGIPVYDLDTGIETTQRFLADVSEFTPMRSQDTADETQKNRGYFIVDIDILRTIGESTFTQ